MKCPIDNATLISEVYEGIRIDKCPECGGIWLDAGELAHINEAREKRFSSEELAVMAKAEPIHGLPLEDVDRNLTSPKSGVPLKPVNYGGDTGIIIDTCEDGIWLDAAELEAIQGLVEAWENQLPSDIKAQRKLLDKVEKDLDIADDNHYSMFAPLNLLVNGVIDKFIMK